ncbi:MAG: hypothetical protein E7H06_22200, partial [Enterobacter asburiae]|nr:hypothetical protein [Enterobacter asburiae]
MAAVYSGCPGGGALRLSGLPARRRRGTRSPVSAAPLGKQSAEWLNLSEAMLRICPGYRPADGGGPVARSAQRHRETKRR